MQENTARIFPAIIQILKSTKAISKNRENDGQKYMFRGIDDVFNEIHDHFAEAGVFVLPEVLEEKREERVSSRGNATFYTFLRVRFTFTAEDGSSVSCITNGEGMDSGDKSTNKAMSGALKYALLQMLLIPTGDSKDSENDNHTIKPNKGSYQAPPKQQPAPKQVAPKPTDEQLQARRDQLTKLLDNPHVKAEEKAAMTPNIPSMDFDRLNTAIARLTMTIEERSVETEKA